MSDWPEPPPLARRLLERVVPAELREVVSGDLTEMFRRECRTYGVPRARLRYWQQAVSFWRHFSIERWRDRRRGGVMRIGISWLDVKLGLRMLVRYPGLSIAGGLGIALVVVCGTAAGLFHAVVHAGLPFEDGDRIVAIENWDTNANRPRALTRRDFETWRTGLTTVENVGAFRLVRRNVSAVGVAAEPVRIAEISAEAFRVARVQPLFGRYLLPGDEQAAARVIVIGEEEWRRRFAGDPGMLGRTIQVGEASAALVGVMPKGFGFPVNERYWMPLALREADFVEGRAPSHMPYKEMPLGALHVFGRLGDDVDVDAAQAELRVVGQRAAAESPGTHAQVRPRVLPYTRWFFDEQHDGETQLVQALVLLILGIVGANVGVLVYARTATRRIEIAVRSAIGASRARIVGQMFVEALVLSLAAAGAGLLVARAARTQLDAFVPWHLAPFWTDASLTSPTVAAYVLGVAVLGAVVVGVVPALQATGRRAQAGLQQAAAATSSWKIGRSYAVLTVVQVAIAVAILPFAISSAWTSIRSATADPGFAAGEFLTARVDAEGDAASRGGRHAALLERLEAEPGISNVIALAGVPGGEPMSWMEVDGGDYHEVRIGHVVPEFFETFDVQVLAGRSFGAGDRDMPRVIVNRTFAQQVLQGDALGRRVRQVTMDDAGPWLEIVGVVEDFPPGPTTSTLPEGRVYRPMAADDTRAALLAMRVQGGTPMGFAGRLRELTMALDRRLQVQELQSMDALLREHRFALRFKAWMAGLATASLLLLSATGLYALMSFAVTQRRREIGIRVALGADPRRVLRNIFSRAFWQLGSGILIGVIVAGLIDFESRGELTGGFGLPMLPAVALFVLLVGLAAAAGPARRGLRIQPTEALKEH